MVSSGCSLRKLREWLSWRLCIAVSITGKGLYDYSDRSREEVQAERDEKVMKVVKLAREMEK